MSIGIDDGVPVVEAAELEPRALQHVSRTARLVLGRDRGFAVCRDDYQPPFPLSGRVHRAVLHAPTPQETW